LKTGLSQTDRIKLIMKPAYLIVFITALISLIISAGTASGQRIENCRFEWDNIKISVSYDLIDNQQRLCVVDLFYSADSGLTFIGPLKKVSGDIGKNVLPGVGKKITWDVTTEPDLILGKSITFVVEVHERRDSAFTETVEGVDINMILVEGGSYMMGCPASELKNYPDEIMHRVTLDDFYIGQTEVTIEQYMIFVKATKSHYPEWLEPGNTYNINSNSVDKNYYLIKGMSLSNPDYPVTGISWKDALDYCYWLGDMTGKEYRLCTEAEWEYAANGGELCSGYRYSGSDTLAEVGWYSDNSGNMAHEVKQLKPNGLGLYDMSGNVWEWCSDWYEIYDKEPQTNPEGPLAGIYRVDRGGAWSSYPERCTIWFRLDDGPLLRDFNLGFRLACEP
jgi:sulfatase modifying factor 1